MRDPYAEVELQIARMLDYPVAVAGAESREQLGELYEWILKALDGQMGLLYEKFDAPEVIEAGEVLLHVRDRATGQMYSRRLPLDYEENNNGVTIAGETLEGQPSRIAFLSNQAVEKMHELMGEGLNKPRCNH